MAFAVTAGTTSGGATTSPLSVSTPASVASGDLLIAVFESGGSSTTPSVTATGWTALFTSRNQVAATGNTQMHALARISDGTEGASQSFTLSTGTINHWSGRMFGVTGHGVATISTDIVVGATTGGAASGSSPQTVSGIGGITVTAASAIFILGTTALDANSTAQFSGWTNTDPNSFTEVADNVVLTGNGGGFGLAWGTSTGTTTGAAGFVEATNEAWNGVQFGVKPASGTQFSQTVAVTATLTPADTNQTSKILVQTATLAPSLAKQLPRTIAATATLTVGVLTSKVKMLAVAVATTVTVGLSRTVGKPISVAATLGVAVVRQTGKTLATSSALTAALTRQFARTIAAAVIGTIGLTTARVKMLMVAIGVTLSAVVSKQVGKAVALIATLAPAFAKRMTRALAVTATLTAAVVSTRVRQVAIAVTSALQALIGTVKTGGGGPAGVPVDDPLAVLVGTPGQGVLGIVSGEADILESEGQAMLGG